MTFNRRNWLEKAGLTIGGFPLFCVLTSRTQAGKRLPGSDAAVIFVTMGGGPSQLETYDPKPKAPVEYRGTFSPIPTKTPGQAFCELFPRQAAISDRLTVIRSIHHEQASHIAEHIVETGYDLRSAANARSGEMPSVGAVVSKIRGANAAGIPGYVSIPKHHAYAGAHWLGAQHHHFAVNNDPNQDDFQVSNLALCPQLDLNRLQDRSDLLRELDQQKRIRDLAGQADSLDAISKQAFDLITGEKARRAFEIRQEPAALREKYGRNTIGQRVLLARRLVEAGVPFVTVRTPGWDDHQDLDQKLKKRAPIFDQALAALIEDLADRGLSQRVLIVAMGEFGRTPRINKTGGRDHWPGVLSVMISGGRYRMGQVIGATDAKAGRVIEAPYRPQNVLTMVYRHLGIDPGQTFNDYSGRPRHILEERRTIAELI